MPKKVIVWQNKTQLNKNHWHKSTIQSFTGLIKILPGWEKNLIVKSGLEFLEDGVFGSKVEDPPEVTDSNNSDEQIAEPKPTTKGKKKVVGKD